MCRWAFRMEMLISFHPSRSPKRKTNFSPTIQKLMGNIFSISVPCNPIVNSRCWDSFFRQAEYVRKLGVNLQALTCSLEELIAAKNDVKTRVEVAERQRFTKRLEQVELWIQRVETLETEVIHVVSGRDQEIEKLCCGGCCSKDYLSSYRYGKRVARKLLEVDALKRKGYFEEVAAESSDIPTVVNKRPSEPTVGLESMLDKAWNHVEDEEVGIIGLYGMGGVGKTTLLTQIHNKLLQISNVFDLVIWIVVSKDHKLGTLQDKIGKKIGLSNGEWKDNDHDEKAGDIYRVLTKKKFVLLLDDIWEPVEVRKLGVPVPDKRNKSKIIFSTRSENLCGCMDAQKTIKVECLKWENAWNLFQEKVGKETLYVHPDIPKLAESVAKECGGLPLALIVVGQAMACKKTPQEWNHALHILKKYAAEFSGMGDAVFPHLKLSYDYLPSEKVRSCFLYCALFPEDSHILKENLLYLWMCEEMIDEYGNVDQGKNEAYYIIGALRTACLLEDGGGDYVKMHDVIRDMALWLACDYGKHNDKVLVYAADHGTLDVKRWKIMKRVSLCSSNIECVVETPNSPKLLTLFITSRGCHGECLDLIADGFFNYMPSLRVLNLSFNGRLAALPYGVSNLLSLKYLNLSYTRIRELPVELKACVGLKYLDLNYTYELDFVPPNVISSFQMLKVLRLFECGFDDRILFDGEGALIEEIQSLKHLDELALSTRSTFCFQKIFSYHTLVKCTRSLCISDSKNQSNIVIDISSLVDMKHLSSLLVHNYPKLEAMKISRVGQESTNHLRKSMVESQSSFLHLQSIEVRMCPNLKDLTWLIFAPMLSSIRVSDCDEMEKIIALEKLGGEENVVEEPSPFGKLNNLTLYNLPLLKSIYDSTLPFMYLDMINVDKCPELKKLPLNSTSAQTRKVIIKGAESWWNGLEWEDQVARNAFLPCFRVGKICLR